MIDIDFADDPTPKPSPASEWDTAKPVPVVRESTPAEPPPAPRQLPAVRNLPAPMSLGFVGRSPPSSIEAEEYLLSCCLIDGGETLSKCLSAHLCGDAFYFGPNRVIFDRLVQMQLEKKPVSVEVLVEELNATRQLDSVGGVPYLIQVSGRSPTTAQASYFIQKVRQLYQLREAIKIATSTVEQCYQWDGTDDRFLSSAQERFASLAQLNGVKRPAPKSFFDFKLPADGDHSILLGNRYLNRGDGGVLVGTSGIGKSSIEKQMAVMWALGRSCFGIQPNGCLRSLMIQAEDSDGDIAEVRTSLQHGLKLSPADIQKIHDSVLIFTDRKNRGDAFLANSSHLIDDFDPDIVWINPLQAFMAGDVTRAEDLGKFLREGLNGFHSDPPSFGYILVHHTTKPATGKDRAERLWHEVMYDMAGGAEIINWARFIMSLRPSAQEGEFNLVLAKRGKRAGATKRIPQGMGWREEPLTTIPLRHSKDLIEIPGWNRKLPVIFWESRDADPVVEPPPEKSSKKAPKDLPEFTKYRSALPAFDQPGADLDTIYRNTKSNNPVSRTQLYNFLQAWMAEGIILATPATKPGETITYRLPPVPAMPSSPYEGPETAPLPLEEP